MFRYLPAACLHGLQVPDKMGAPAARTKHGIQVEEIRPAQHGIQVEDITV